jgi:hypothetical protein
MAKSDELVLTEHLRRLRGDPALPPEASIVVPVNAQNDLQNVLLLVEDISSYHGKHRLEIILVINNYPEDAPPGEIDKYRAFGLGVLAIPKIKTRAEVYLAVRVAGARSTVAECTIHFDADCHLPDATSLIDWYIAQFAAGAQLAYTYVGYYNLPTRAAMQVRMALYNSSRWFKRVILRIPVSRGSNYAVKRSLLLKLYDEGSLNYDIKLGTTIKSIGGKVAYSGDKTLEVLTSGRNFRGDWTELFEYIFWRVGYYRRLGPLQPDAVRSDGKLSNGKG